MKKDVNIFVPYKMRITVSYPNPNLVKPSNNFIMGIARTMKKLFDDNNKDLNTWVNILHQKQWKAYYFTISSNFYLITSAGSSSDMNQNLQQVINKHNVQNVTPILDVSGLLTQYASVLAKQNKKPSIKSLYDLVHDNIKPLNIDVSSVDNSAYQKELKQDILNKYAYLVSKDVDLNDEAGAWVDCLQEVLNNVSLSGTDDKKDDGTTSKFIRLAVPFASASLGGSRSDYAASHAARVMGQLRITSINSPFIIKLRQSIYRNALNPERENARLNRYVKAINERA